MSGRHRGVALLMVMVCLCVGIIIASVALTSTDPVAAIAKNAIRATESKWAAESEAALAVAALQTSAAWKDGNRELFVDRVIPGGSVRVSVRDLEGNAPEDDDLDVIVTADAVVNGVSSSVSKLVHLTPDATVGDAFDPWLHEFAAFATAELEVEAGCHVSVWSRSPRAMSAVPAKIGMGFGSSAGYKIAHGANAALAEIYTDSTSSTALRSLVTSQPHGKGVVLQVPLPKVAETLPSDFSLLLIRSFFPLSYTGSATNAVLPAGRYQSLVLDKSATVTLNGNAGLMWSFDDLTLQDKSVVVISGDARVQVRGALQIKDGATIALADEDARVTLYLMGDATVDAAGLGVEKTVARKSDRMVSDLVAYQTPTRVRVIGVAASSGGKEQPTYTFDSKSLVCSSIHAPTAKVTLVDRSMLVGRVSAGYLSIKSHSELLADPALDRGVGFTNLTGPLYKSNGAPLDGLVQAIKGYNVANGVGGLLNAVTMAVTPEPPPVTEAGVTPRDRERAKKSAVARSAFGLEGNSGATSSAEASVEVEEP